MGWMTGFEPATSGSTIRRSNQLSYTHQQGCAGSGNLNKVKIVAATSSEASLVIREVTNWETVFPIVIHA